MSLGNDVVDLGDPEARLDGLHPRFAERVFTPAERGRLEASGEERPVLHWALWAAKESAYKALARLEPRTVFAPRAFEVELAGPPGSGVPAAGRVRHGSRSFALEVSRRGDAVHAVAWEPDGPGAAAIRSAVGATHEDPGVAVRCLAARGIGAALSLDPREVGVVGWPPVAVRDGRRLDLVVSLSHHGRVVACAWCASVRARARGRRLPERSRGDRATPLPGLGGALASVSRARRPLRTPGDVRLALALDPALQHAAEHARVALRPAHLLAHAVELVRAAPGSHAPKCSAGAKPPRAPWNRERSREASGG